MSDFPLNYTGPDNQQISLTISSGEFLFLVGANGTGKSTLMQTFATQNIGHVRRITAHRQVWFQSDTVDITPQARQQTETNISNSDRQDQSRWKDDYAAQRSQVTIFDLIDSENVDARKIAAAARSGNIGEVQSLAAAKAPVAMMNDILQISNLDFQVNIVEGSALKAKREGHDAYSIAELSDGERNALLIIANVLTAPENTLILLDEPERHLHRSIVSPLLSTLLAYREDCAFVISTHDVSLPLDQPKCGSLLVRSYNHNPKSWTTDHIEAVEAMDEETASAVLGSRRIILFTEGTPSSLDLQVYQILFPFASIRPVGSCVEVERIVRGIRASEGSHWISAFGIIDRDNRSDEDCERLKGEGVIPLNQYTVESLYYHPETIRSVLNRVAGINGIDVEAAFSEMTDGVVKGFSDHQDRMAARLVERRVRDSLLSHAPNWNEILSGNVEINYSSESILNDERQYIAGLIENNDIAGLISRYPARETPALEAVARCLGFQSKDAYEQAVRKMLCDSEDSRSSMLNLVEAVTNTVDSA
jgi:ABC-type cobalamin/Fe3+-siderophores transport system ATPase subunit